MIKEHIRRPMQLTQNETLTILSLLEEKLDDMREVGATEEEFTEVEELYTKAREARYANWEKESLDYAPDYYTIENDYDDDVI